MFKYCT